MIEGWTVDLIDGSSEACFAAAKTFCVFSGLRGIFTARSNQLSSLKKIFRKKNIAYLTTVKGGLYCSNQRLHNLRLYTVARKIAARR
ncbi:hypothetical protein [Desulfatitalea tepidiphila]|uniref:hypothetical protein n=1 Tax=Desulfatitalea tepidiphila TaxID=1185843 RepID=UPI00128F87E1|nr:hypothetical protein [Desulfatitalea tepidiphila]